MKKNLKKEARDKKRHDIKKLFWEAGMKFA
jgi:hypothetical protein